MLRRTISAWSRRPIVRPTPSRRIVTGLSAITCRRSRTPFFLGGFNRHTKIGCIAQIRGHLTDHNRGVRRWQGVGLHDYRRSRLAVVAGGSNCDDVAALHLESNSETASIHLMASSSRSRSSAATPQVRNLRAVSYLTGRRRQNEDLGWSPRLRKLGSSPLRRPSPAPARFAWLGHTSLLLRVAISGVRPR